MWSFGLLVAMTFFVLGGLALALPWSGIVSLAERQGHEAELAATRYLGLLITPSVLLALFVLTLLGPWDAAVCQKLHEACLDRISSWRLPKELALVFTFVAVIAVGRFARPYIAARSARPWTQAELSPSLASKWATIQAEVQRICGTVPVLVPVRSDRPMAHVRGVLNPRVVLSESLLEALDHDEVVGVICHEVAHVRRLDLPLGLFAYICHCALFFMPTSRHCYARYLQERELAADDWAVAHTHKPLALASALARVGRAQMAAQGAAPFHSSDALLARRLERLSTGMAVRVSPRPRALAIGLSVLLVAVLVGSLATLHLAIEGWGRGFLATLGVID